MVAVGWTLSLMEVSAMDTTYEDLIKAKRLKDKVANDIAEFLVKGGSITTVPTGVGV